MTKRNAERRAVRAPVSVSSSARGQRAALSADVSSGGICLESPTLLAPGTELSGYVLHGDLELGWSGRVAWAEPAPEGGWHRLGVRFTGLSPGLAQLLSKHPN